MTSFADVARAHFPALLSGFVFADNAGGSQCTKLVANRIFDYLINTNAQLGTDYSVSAETRRVSAGIVAAAELLNVASSDEVVRRLDDEVIVVTVEHEANVGPWKELAARKGLTLKHWHPRITDPSNPYSLAYDLALTSLALSSRSRVLAAARSRAAELGVVKIEFSVDCVAYAPHRRMDVQDWDADYAVFSFYKVSSNLVFFDLS
ncbi:pyridoxal phosphate-dependent transferase [Lactarius hatsudake]|nr:pyridoxal phosphate-dependent transferase [Lactarius hatsudake]